MWTLCFVFLGLPSQPAPANWEFRDEAAYQGRSLLTFRAVELGDKPARPLGEGDKPTAKALYSLLQIGTEPAAHPALVWLPEAGQIWLDADGDGRFAPEERHTLGAVPLEVSVVIRVRNPGKEPQGLKRTIVFRRAADGGLRYAVRGFAIGTLRLGDQDYPALLTDGNADGCFDSAAHDRIWIDLDRDGRFDGLTEQFPLGKPLTAGMKTYLLKPLPDGGGVEVRERPTQTGTLRILLKDKPGEQATAFSAQLVSDWGELITLTDATQAVSLPTGRYRVDAMTFQLAEANGRKWLYHLAGGQRFEIEVSQGKETAAAVLRGLKLAVEVDVGKAGVLRGANLSVTPILQTPAGIYVVSCQTCEAGREDFTSTECDIRLINARGETVGQDKSGFH